MTKAVTYARFSTDLQNEDSIAAQEDACMRYAAKRGWTVAHHYADQARSGQDSFRPDFLALQDAIRRGRLSAIIVNSIDRLSRRAADLHSFHDLCKFHQVPIHVVELNGELTDLHIGFEGIISQQYIEGIRHKTRTGLRRVVEQGGWGGGKAFGYRIVYDEDGSRSMIIDEAQADIVRQIFELYASGISPRKIAGTFNRRGLLSPRGKSWTASTIQGNAARQNGILNNKLYIGEYVWNRQRHVKNPDNSKRTSRANPKDDFVIVERSELRIVEDELWTKVKKEQAKQLAAMKDKFGPNAFGGARRKQYLLSGLVKCTVCGGDYISQGAKRWACGNHRDRGSCSNAQGFKIEYLEALLFQTLKADLLKPEVIEEAAKEIQKQLQERLWKNRGLRQKLLIEKQQVEERVSNIVSAISAGAFSEALRGELERLEARLADITEHQAVASYSDEVIPLPANFTKLYQGNIDRLVSLFEAPEEGEAREQIRSLIDKITVYPTKRGQAPEFEVYGSLAGILAFAYGQEGAGSPPASLEAGYRLPSIRDTRP